MTQHAVAFNTLAFAKKLETSGLETKYAESIAEAISDVFEENLNNTLFTKEDGKLLQSTLRAEMFEIKSELKVEISELRTELKTEISEVKSDLKAETSELRSNMYKLKSDIIMWVVGLLFAQTAIIISVTKFLH